MKVLLLTQVLPHPPDSGPKIETWNVLKYLAGRHEVTLVSFARGDQAADAGSLEPYCRAVHTVPIARGTLRDLSSMASSLVRREPFLMLRDDRAAMRRLVDRVAAAVRFDIVHADQLNMVQYAARVPAARRVFDAHNAVWLVCRRLEETLPAGPKRWLLRRDSRLLKRYEGGVCRACDAVLAVSEEDKAALEDAAGTPVNVTVMPISIDTQEVTEIARHPDADHVVHIGTMFWPPNADGVSWFLREVWPLIRARRPGAVFDVVGPNPPAAIRALHRPHTGVNVTGHLVDPSPILRRAAVMVVPLRAGGGMRVKILTALAQGIPIVSTTLGCEGIAVVPGRHLVVADAPSSFATAVINLLSAPAHGLELARNGRRLVEERYDYRQACRLLDAVYERAVHAPP